ncbi:MAG TPA: hypothetical protein VJ728_02405 [Candidatus Binataceae bacterium]|nr:hypothetical protein [Candidatus Binataceae bacterium]
MIRYSQICPACLRVAVHFLLVLAIAVGLNACARAARVQKPWIVTGRTAAPQRKGKHKSAPAFMPPAVRTSTLEITPGIHVAGIVPLPLDFAPDMGRPPLWLVGGSEIGVVGTRADKGMMLGFSGTGLSQRRVLIEDYRAGANGGRLLDLAVNPGGNLLATAVDMPAEDRVDINVADASRPDQTSQLGSLEGEFDSVELSWLRTEIAILTQASSSPSHSAAESTALASIGLYLITTGQKGGIKSVDRIKCPLSMLAFSPNETFAVGQGNASAHPSIIDLRSGKCIRGPSPDPIQVLGWAPDSASFLYRTADQGGVFRFDLTSGQSSTIAVSSGAAAYASDGTIIAFGSQQLSWQRAIAEPQRPVKAQIALLDPHQSLRTINSLGFTTQPALLAQSTMVFSHASNDAVIDTAIPGTTGLIREIIEYSYPSRTAFLLAHGAVKGPIQISWSPNGRELAILDGDASSRTLAVIDPPR